MFLFYISKDNTAHVSPMIFFFVCRVGHQNNFIHLLLLSPLCLILEPIVAHKSKGLLTHWSKLHLERLKIIHLCIKADSTASWKMDFVWGRVPPRDDKVEKTLVQAAGCHVHSTSAMLMNPEDARLKLEGWTWGKLKAIARPSEHPNPYIFTERRYPRD